MPEGRCKLTGKLGRFVKCHIIPEAVTRAERKGAHLVQFGTGKPTRRWTSWYDPELVTAQGEGILARYDSWAIAQLRRHKLIWSSWGSSQALAADDFRPFPPSPWGLRSIRNFDTAKLRLFYLSVLWRVAATNLPEFAQIQLPNEEIDQLRTMLLEGSIEPLTFYPISLIQISTRGTAHNRPPVSQTKRLVEPEENVPIVRIYFDGLIAHLHGASEHASRAIELGPIIIGNEDRMTINTVAYEDSSQRAALIIDVAGAYADWPEDMARKVELEEILGEGHQSVRRRNQRN